MPTSEDISPTTGEAFYSGSWKNIKDLVRVLNIGDSMLTLVTPDLVNSYQEMVDRQIDSELSHAYHTPFVSMNKMQPTGDVVKVFPGDIVTVARYMSAGLLLSNEFTQIEPNKQEQVEGYLQLARQKLIMMARLNHRVPGADAKGFPTKTMPPNMQPTPAPSRDF